MKIGIIGGTFDPIHLGHLSIAKAALAEYKLDKVLFMPSPNPPHKNQAEITPINTRIEMIKLAICDEQDFELSDFELKREGVIYSADTLSLFKETHPDDDLYFILGSDSVYTLDSWYKPDIIFKNVNILAAVRGDVADTTLDGKIDNLSKEFNAKIFKLNVPAFPVSSTKIRQSQYDNLTDVVPEKVALFIKNNEVYGKSKGSKRMTNAEIIEDLKNILDEYRFEHTMGVANTAKKMAEELGENPNKAYLAGLLHDCAKCLTHEERVNFCNKHNIFITESEYKNPSLLHAKVGAFLVKSKYFIVDEDIINSVMFHTTGRENMSLLEKIIFTADYIEPGRTKQPNLSMLREIAYTDIDYTVYLILKDTLDYLDKTGAGVIDNNTMKALNYYREVIETR